MAESTRNSDNWREIGENRVEDLHLDRVVASQPEIGPSPPDGGYGWLIVVSAVIYHVTVPALLSLYGLVILKAIREDDHDENEVFKIWDVDLALVPVIMVVIRLLMESWCRAMVKVFNMPRFMALSGLCLTVAGVLLSSFSTDAESNDHIINVFAGIFIGLGCALTGQQTDVIITHYFREKLTVAQRLVRVAPSLGNCLVPLLVGFLCTKHTGDTVVMIYGAIIMQNCVFLASYSRPVYIEKVIRHTYNVIRDAVEDDDEIIFSNNRQETEVNIEQPTSSNNHEEDNDVVVFKSKKNAKEIVDSAAQEGQANRFSSDFGSMFSNEPANNRFSSDFGFNSNRFSSDFSTFDPTNARISGYRELESIDRDDLDPQPLYRQTTEDAPQSLVFPTEMTPGSAKRTATLRKNLITVVNMLMDVNFYLYALLHMTTTFSVLMLGVTFPPMVWEANPTMNIWSVAVLLGVAHGSAFCFIMLCIALPKTINEKNRLCAMFCVTGAMGFYGITLSSSKSFLVVSCILASISTACASILEQPLYNSLNEFDNTATMTTSNLIAATFIMAWSLVRSFEYRTCFLTASILQTVTAVAFFIMSFRRRR